MQHNTIIEISKLKKQTLVPPQTSRASKEHRAQIRENRKKRATDALTYGKHDAPTQ